MAHTPVHAATEHQVTTPSKLLYGLNDKPNVKDSLFVAFQHVCAIFIPIVTPGLLITQALGLDPSKASYILGMSLFVSGIGPLFKYIDWDQLVRVCYPSKGLVLPLSRRF